MDVDQRVAYMQRILGVSVLKKYKAVLLECKQSSKDLAGYKWNLGELKGLSTDDFWTWYKSDGISYDLDAHPRLEKCVDLKKYIWFDLGKAMWRKNRSVFQDHLKYICNDTVKPFLVGILRYAKRIQDMHDLANNLPPPLMKGNGYEEYNWKFRNKEFSVHDIRVAIRDGLP